MNPVQQVFDCEDLRKHILRFVLYPKYKAQLCSMIEDIIMSEVTKKWYRYCHCEICKANREYYIATYGELI